MPYTVQYVPLVQNPAVQSVFNVSLGDPQLCRCFKRFNKNNLLGRCGIGVHLTSQVYRYGLGFRV